LPAAGEMLFAPLYVSRTDFRSFSLATIAFRFLQIGRAGITRCFAASATAALHSISGLWQYQ
jgi:hypothetical protein